VNKLDIIEKVTNYAELDAKAKQLEELKKPLNAEIKSYMKHNDLKEVSAAGIKAVYGKQERVSMNQDKLLDKVKQLGLNHAIKTIEVVDEQVLESMIFNGELNASQIEECMERKIIETLTIKGGKKG
jgi:vancomycin resistance protein YoaR